MELPKTQDLLMLENTTPIMKLYDTHFHFNFRIRCQKDSVQGVLLWQRVLKGNKKPEN